MGEKPFECKYLKVGTRHLFSYLCPKEKGNPYSAIALVSFKLLASYQSTV